MKNNQLLMPCGCQVQVDFQNAEIELKYCGIHTHAPALLAEVLDVIDYFSDDWPGASEEHQLNLKRKADLIDQISAHRSTATQHDFEQHEQWPAIDVCTVCGTTEEAGNHSQGSTV